MSGVKIFSLTVSWRKKLISLLTSTTILCRFHSFWYVKVCDTHCRFECDRLLKTFGWHLQQLGHHPDFLCAYYRCNLLTLSLYPHEQRQSLSLQSIIHNHMWVFMTKRPGVAGSRHFPDEGQKTEPCRCWFAPLEWSTRCPWNSADVWNPLHHLFPLWYNSLPILM